MEAGGNAQAFETTEIGPRGIEVLRSLDSRCFGFLGFQNLPCQQASCKSGERPHEAKFISKDFIHMGIKKLKEDLLLGPQSVAYQSELMCQLGHLHLLLEEYPQAMSAYQQYQSLCTAESATNVNYLYGLGLIHFHMSAYKWAIEIFYDVLRLSPAFARSSEVHLRLGTMFKKRGEYRRSIDHFTKALSIPGPSSFNKLEIQFHIGHLHYLQSNHTAAKETFEGILSSKAVPSTIKAKALRQLGWLYHTVPEVSSSSPDPHTKATELLKLAVNTDPTSSQAWYFLGRCHAHQGRVHDAFMAYQYAITRSATGQGDTWCSIGLLYHKMGQLLDSLQSYFCTVYVDPQNLAAWMNMGCVYEAAAQPMDALISYKNAVAVIQGRNENQTPIKCSEFVFSRVSNLEQCLSMLGASLHNQPKSLPTFYEAWSTLVPPDIRLKYSPPSTPILNLHHSPTPLQPNHMLLPPNFPSLCTPGIPGGLKPLGGLPPTKRARTSRSRDPIIIKSIHDGWNKYGYSLPGGSDPTAMTQNFEFGTNNSGMRNGNMKMESLDIGMGNSNDRQRQNSFMGGAGDLALYGCGRRSDTLLHNSNLVGSEFASNNKNSSFGTAVGHSNGNSNINSGLFDLNSSSNYPLARSNFNPGHTSSSSTSSSSSSLDNAISYHHHQQPIPSLLQKNIDKRPTYLQLSPPPLPHSLEPLPSQHIQLATATVPPHIKASPCPSPLPRRVKRGPLSPYSPLEDTPLASCSPVESLGSLPSVLSESSSFSDRNGNVYSSVSSSSSSYSSSSSSSSSSASSVPCPEKIERIRTLSLSSSVIAAANTPPSLDGQGGGDGDGGSSGGGVSPSGFPISDSPFQFSPISYPNTPQLSYNSINTPTAQPSLSKADTSDALPCISPPVMKVSAEIEYLDCYTSNNVGQHHHHHRSDVTIGRRSSLDAHKRNRLSSINRANHQERNDSMVGPTSEKGSVDSLAFQRSESSNSEFLFSPWLSHAGGGGGRGERGSLVSSPIETLGGGGAGSKIGSVQSISARTQSGGDGGGEKGSMQSMVLSPTRIPGSDGASNASDLKSMVLSPTRTPGSDGASNASDLKSMILSPVRTPGSGGASSASDLKRTPGGGVASSTSCLKSMVLSPTRTSGGSVASSSKSMVLSPAETLSGSGASSASDLKSMILSPTRTPGGGGARSTSCLKSMVLSPTRTPGSGGTNSASGLKSMILSHTRTPGSGGASSASCLKSTVSSPARTPGSGGASSLKSMILSPTRTPGGSGASRASSLKSMILSPTRTPGGGGASSASCLKSMILSPTRTPGGGGASSHKSMILSPTRTPGDGSASCLKSMVLSPTRTPGSGDASGTSCLKSMILSPAETLGGSGASSASCLKSMILSPAETLGGSDEEHLITIIESRLLPGISSTSLSQGEVLKMKTTIVKQVQELTTPFQPDLLKPNAEVDITFSTSPYIHMPCKQYGKISSPGSPDPSRCNARGKDLEVAASPENAPPPPPSSLSLSSQQDHHQRGSLSLEEVSDSGVSSAGTKPSSTCSSENNSPRETTTPVIITSPTDPPPTSSFTEGHFSYPPSPHVIFSLSSPPPLDNSTTESNSSSSLLDPIYEPFPSLVTDSEYMTLNPVLSPPSPPQYCSSGSDEVDLHPQVEIYQVKDKEDGMSVRLHTFCSNPDRPVCMVRGLCSKLDVDISLFSSESLTQTSPDHEVEIRDQLQQEADENLDPSGRRQVWKCESSRSLTTIKEYAEYQKRVYLGQDDSAPSDHGDSQSSDCSKSLFRKPRKMIRFGTNLDLSDEEKWSTQLNQLQKLPKFFRVACPEADFLTHIGHTIQGMNSVQLYMKVPGARTPGHQENNNFCSINMNIGPGDCEWFAVHNKYWGAFHKMCEKHKLCFLTGSWWPILNDLYEQNIPVYQFTQYKGDIVWLNPGTVHWVQANNACNNVAWNLGPLTAHQFRMSWERYQWNKIHRVRSIVPMVHMAWNLVTRVKIVYKTLYLQLRSLLESSLVQSKLLLAHLEKAGIQVHWHGIEKNDPAPCCNDCLDEVFNILFVLNHRGEYLVFCHKCATAMKKSFTVLQQYKIQTLNDILTSFKLHPSSANDSQ